MAKPKIKPPLSGYEIFLEVFAFLVFLVFIGLIVYYYPRLPATIPTHYNFSGQPDAWGDKSNLLFLAIVTFVLYFGLSLLNRFPYIFNYPVEINEKNVARQYQMARTLLSFLKTSMIIIFLLILYTNIRIANGYNLKLAQGYMIMVVIALLILPLIVYLAVAIRSK